MTVLDRYIVRSILGFVLLVQSVLLILGGLVIFIDQQDDIGVGHYGALNALWFTLLNLPQQAGYEVYARTSSGSISVDAPMTNQNVSNRGREVRGTVRGGGHILDLHTGSGDIRVR